MKKRNKQILIISSIVLATVIGAAVFYVTDDLDATPEALAYMQSSGQVGVVETKNYVAFEPIFGQSTTTGIIFFQGGKVDHRAYAPLLFDIATHNVLTIAVISPLKLAMFATGIPDKVLDAYPTIEHWIVMGHSLGGVFGSNYAFENENIDGIILLASYVIKDFSTSSQSFLSITASEDLVLNQESYIDSLPLLPSMTTFVEIQGGNHGQFGDYGPQPKDGVATIDTITQRTLVVNATTEWINTNFVDG